VLIFCKALASRVCPTLISFSWISRCVYSALSRPSLYRVHNAFSSPMLLSFFQANLGWPWCDTPYSRAGAGGRAGGQPPDRCGQWQCSIRVDRPRPRRRDGWFPAQTLQQSGAAGASRSLAIWAAGCRYIMMHDRFDSAHGGKTQGLLCVRHSFYITTHTFLFYSIVVSARVDLILAIILSNCALSQSSSTGQVFERHLLVRR
jgi:hypothetical protein